VREFGCFSVKTTEMWNNFERSSKVNSKNDDKTVNSVQDHMEASPKWIRTKALKQKWQDGPPQL